MMRAKTNQNPTIQAIQLLACVFLAGGLIGIVLPRPSVTSVTAKEKSETKKLTKEATKAKTNILVAKATVMANTWTEDPTGIQDKTYSMVSQLASKRKVSLVRFQPSRVTVAGDLTQYPFLVVAEGPFPAIVAFQKDIEASTNRLAVSSFQVTSSDSESNKVSASIGVIAHRMNPEAPEKENKSEKRA